LRSGLRLNGTDLWLRLNRPVLGLHRAHLRLGGPAFWLCRSGLGLARTYFRLFAADWLDLRSVVRLFGPVWHRSEVGTRDASLRGDGTRGRNHRRPSLVDVIELLTVLGGFALVLKLGGHRWNARAAHGCDLSRLWPHGDAASAAVVGDAGVVVDDDSAVVDVGDVDVDAVDGAIVVEVVAVPIAAMITDAGVTEAIVDATIEANMKAPEAAVKAVSSAVEAPVAGSPERAVVRGSAPCARNPIVAGGRPVPVAGSPDVIGRGSNGLLVDREWRRRLVGVFDGRTLTLGVELVIGLRVLISLVLVWWSGLLRGGLGSILFGALLGLGLVTGPKNLSRGRRGGRLWLAAVDGRHVNVGRIRAGVVGDGCGIGPAVTARCSGER
jgi:hypothetical protein